MTSTAPRAVVLVEGASDRVALATLAARRGRDLTADGIQIIDMGGITNVRAFATRYGPLGRGLTLAGLYDAAQERQLRRGLAAAGFADATRPDGPARLGFYGCHGDLEEELIRALGVDRVETVIAAAGDGPSLRRLLAMPAQRGRPREAVLRRFFGSRAGRKERYAALLVAALDPDRVPAPLTAVLDRCAASVGHNRGVDAAADPRIWCCLLWAHEGRAAALGRYEDRVLAILADHGGRVRLRATGAGDDGHPHEVQLIEFATDEGLDGFLHDPRRTALAPERDRVVARTDLFPVTLP